MSDDRHITMAVTEEFTIGSSVNAAVAAFSKCMADRGKHDLKGVPGHWRLFAVESP